VTVASASSGPSYLVPADVRRVRGIHAWGHSGGGSSLPGPHSPCTSNPCSESSFNRGRALAPFSLGCLPLLLPPGVSYPPQASVSSARVASSTQLVRPHNNNNVLEAVPQVPPLPRANVDSELSSRMLPPAVPPPRGPMFPTSLGSSDRPGLTLRLRTGAVSPLVASPSASEVIASRPEFLPDPAGETFPPGSEVVCLDTVSRD